MLDAVVAVLAVLLVGTGVAVMVGPALPRAILGLLRRRRPPRARARRRQPKTASAGEAATLHPTTQKAVFLAARIGALLRAQARDAQAAELKNAVQRVRGDEASGLYALLAAARSLREVSLDQADAERELQRLLGELRQTVRDRAEQLELLPFPG